MPGYYCDEQTLREVIEAVGKTAAAACISSLLGVILSSAVNTKPTKILVEDGVPAALYTIGKNDKPSVVYVSARNQKADWKPVIFFGAVFAGCKLILDHREKNIANVSNK